VIAISQSGETADTMAAIKLAKERGAFVFWGL
jgi:glucosamine--fructose-6-phosphate aminotransferase (isomerizing)